MVNSFVKQNLSFQTVFSSSKSKKSRRMKKRAKITIRNTAQSPQFFASISHQLFWTNNDKSF
ncbi:hypothetical protein HanIR_Chr15g0751871 [Helianthus annuus]|nr:hypothetical protein HanIR_Chr15g0751871 [Helianthus annuus]